MFVTLTYNILRRNQVEMSSSIAWVKESHPEQWTGDSKILYFWNLKYIFDRISWLRRHELFDRIYLTLFQARQASNKFPLTSKLTKIGLSAVGRWAFTDLIKQTETVCSRCQVRHKTQLRCFIRNHQARPGQEQGSLWQESRKTEFFLFVQAFIYSNMVPSGSWGKTHNKQSTLQFTDG